MPSWLSRLTLAAILLLLPAIASADPALQCAPSAADKFVGLFTLTNIMWAGGAVFGAICAAVLIFQLWPLLAAIPLVVYEALGYGLSVFCVLEGGWSSGGTRNGLLLFGSLLFGGMVIVSGT